MRKEPAQDLGGDGSSAANAAFSCNVLREHFKHEHYSFSGIYWIKPTSVAVQTYCDQTNFDGGWTLLTQSATNTGWDTANVLRRGTITSDLDTDFSILGYADAIKDAEQVGIDRRSPHEWRGCQCVRLCSGNKAVGLTNAGLFGLPLL